MDNHPAGGEFRIERVSQGYPVLMNELQVFFVIVVPAAAAAFGIPLTLAPVAWARALRWPVSVATASVNERHLTLYFGRCLGVMVLAFGTVCVVAAVRGQVPELLVLQSIFVGVGMTLVHIYGAVKRAQPVTETIEIAFYGGVSAWAISLYVRFY